jgi:hypothetical protein
MSYTDAQMPRRGPADRRILAAAEAKPYAAGPDLRESGDGSSNGVLTQPHKPMPKRKTVTAVACGACKHRKSKVGHDSMTLSIVGLD